MSEAQEKIKTDLDKVITNLKIEGVTQDTKPDEREGLGDLVEKALTSVGITQERFKEFFGLQECNCTERKKFLNGLFSWHKKNIEGNP